MRHLFKALVAYTLIGSLLVPGLSWGQADQPARATRIEGKTEVEKAVGKCVAVVLLGAVVGAVASRREAGRGALVGAGIGAGICAIMLAVASDRDKQRLRQMQLEALNTGTVQQDRWQTEKGEVAEATVTPSAVVQVSSVKTQETVKCTRTNMNLSVGGASSTSSDVVCLQGDSWVTLDKLKHLGIRPSDVPV